MNKTDQLIGQYFHPELGDSRETAETGCPGFTATIITHRNPLNGIAEIRIIVEDRTGPPR